MKKPSFLERLTGSVSVSTYDDDGFDSPEEVFDDEMVEEEQTISERQGSWKEDALEESIDGELPIDMYQTPDAIVIRALVAGVNPNDIDIDITRDMVTLRGRREELQEATDDGYYHRELFWGSFARTVLLPEEVAIDEAEAREKHGLLEIILPKVDKERKTKLNVKTQAK